RTGGTSAARGNRGSGRRDRPVTPNLAWPPSPCRKQLAAELGEARRPTAAKAHPEASAKISLKSTPETLADWPSFASCLRRRLRVAFPHAGPCERAVASIPRSFSASPSRSAAPELVEPDRQPARTRTQVHGLMGRD